MNNPKNKILLILTGILILSSLTFLISADDSLEGCNDNMQAYYQFDANPQTDLGTIHDFFEKNEGMFYVNALEEGGVFNKAVNGKIRGALSFDGVDDYISILSPAGGNLNPLNEITLESWIYPKELTNIKTIIAKYDRSQDQKASYHMFLNEGKLACVFEQDIDIVRGKNTNLATNINNWHHIACSFNTNTDEVKLYINGNEITDTTDIIVGAQPITNMNQNNIDVTIGRATSDDCSSGTCIPNQDWFFNGFIDNLAIYNKEINPSEITQHYEDGLVEKGYCEFEEPEPEPEKKSKSKKDKSNILDTCGDLICDRFSGETMSTCAIDCDKSIQKILTNSNPAEPGQNSLIQNSIILSDSNTGPNEQSSASSLWILLVASILLAITITGLMLFKILYF